MCDDALQSASSVCRERLQEDNRVRSRVFRVSFFVTGRLDENDGLRKRQVEFAQFGSQAVERGLNGVLVVGSPFENVFRNKGEVLLLRDVAVSFSFARRDQNGLRRDTKSSRFVSAARPCSAVAKEMVAKFGASALTIVAARQTMQTTTAPIDRRMNSQNLSIE